jgi:hypothetical protein
MNALLPQSRIIMFEPLPDCFEQLQARTSHIHKLLADWGFTYAGSLDQLKTPSAGQIFQQDSLFIRPDWRQ